MIQQRISDDELKDLIEKATPGPWRVEEGECLVWGDCNPDDLSTWGMGYPVAECKRSVIQVGLPEDVMTANAHLTAAAPDLAADLSDARALCAKLVGALADMSSGWEYIRQRYGDLDGVGWDRAGNKVRDALRDAGVAFSDGKRPSPRSTTCPHTVSTHDGHSTEVCAACGVPMSMVRAQAVVKALEDRKFGPEGDALKAAEEMGVKP